MVCDLEVQSFLFFYEIVQVVFKLKDLRVYITVQHEHVINIFGQGLHDATAHVDICVGGCLASVQKQARGTNSIASIPITVLVPADMFAAVPSAFVKVAVPPESANP